MKGKMKKVVTLILAVALVLSFQVSAFAEEINVNGDTGVTETPVVETETGSASETVALSGDITGTFPLMDGYELATIRYYTDADKTAYAFADFNETASGYDYAFASPYSGFAKNEGTQTKTSEPSSDATVIAYYYSTTKWDGSVDVSWYDPSASEYYISNPAEFAGVAAIVNGSLDGSVKDYMVKGERIAKSEKNSDYTYRFDLKYVVSQWLANQSAAAGTTNDVYMGLAENDFSNKVINLTSDLDMGGKNQDSYAINFGESNYTTLDESIPNWMPIGGFFLADIKDTRTQVRAYFNGQFDGCGHEINNLYCFRWNPWYSGMNYAAGVTSSDDFCAYGYTESVGLFGNIAKLYDNEETPTYAPAIRNLSLSGITVGRRRQGGIVGCISGYDADQTVCIENCANHADVYNTDKFGCGGIVGAAWGVDDSDFHISIINCYNTGDIYADIQCLAAGIVSYNERADVICCYNSGDVSTNGNKRGREIGSDYSGKNYTISDTYYLHKSTYDDPDSCSGAPGYYNATISESSSINFTKPVEVSATEFTDGTLLSKLNVNGAAFVEGPEGNPVLWFETDEAKENSTVTIEQPAEGATITSNVENGSSVKYGTIVRLTCNEDAGWTFKYYTLNGEKLTSNYATVSSDSVIGGVVKSAAAGILNIEDNKYLDITVTKNGIIKEDGVAKEVTNYPVVDGDSLYLKDTISVTVTLKDGVEPSDPNYEFKSEAGLVNPYSYSFVYTNGKKQTGYDNVLEIDSSIEEENAQLTLTVDALTTPKLWTTLADTSWYNDTSKTFTLKTAAQLAGLDKLVEEGNTFSGKTIKLGADIDLTNTDGTTGTRCWNGIGSSAIDSSTGTTVYNAFAGTFDGQNHSIKNYIGVANGLFDSCIGSSTTSMATIKNVSVYGTAKGDNASAILGYGKYVNITNCNSYVDVDISDDLDSGNCAAGIVAQGLDGTKITNCVNYGLVKGCGKIGGIAAMLSTAATATKCVNTGDVILVNYATTGGGLFGEADGAVTQCANYGTVTSLGEGSVANRMGGIAGYTAATTSKTIAYSYNAGKIIDKGGSSNLRIGGLIGWGSRFILSNCFNYGTVSLNSSSSTSYCGSLFGLFSTNTSNKTTKVYTLDSSNAYVVQGKTDADLDKTKTYYKGIVSATADDFKDSDVVLAAINGSSYFVLTNDYPELSFISSRVHVHTGGIATCTEQAVCDVCGLHYGELGADNHTDIEEGYGSYKAAWNVDGYTGDTVCLACGTVLEKGEAIKADTSQKAVTIRVYSGEDKATAKLISEKDYTVAEFDALKSTEPVGYAYGSYTSGKGYSVMMAANSYVTLDTLLKEYNLTLDDIYRFNVITTGTSTDSNPNFKLTPEKIKSSCYFYDAEGNQIYAPIAIAIDHGTYNTGSLEEAAEYTSISGELRLGVGVSEKEFESGSSLGGNKLITPVKTIEIYKKHTLVKTDAKEVTCTEAGNTAYWTCSDCGKYFSDEEGTTEIEKDSWVISAKGHTYEKTDNVVKCSFCGELFTGVWTDGNEYKDGQIVLSVNKSGYIVSNGQVQKNLGVVKIGDDYYYGNSAGKASNFGGTAEIYYTIKESKANGLLNEGLYRICTDGKITTEFLYKNYYYKNGVITKSAGVVKDGDNYYYINGTGAAFNSNGTADYYYTVKATKTNGLIDAGFYKIGKDGKIAIAFIYNNNYYYENGSIGTGKGIVQVDGNLYYVNNKGVIYKNGTATIKETKTNGLCEAGSHTFDENGVMVK